MATGLLFSSMMVSFAGQAAAADFTEIGIDSFSRSDRDGWGTAALGGPYSYKGAPDVFALQNYKGVMRGVDPGTAAEAYLDSVSGQDVRVQSIVTVPSVDADSLNLHHTLEGRRQDDGSTYRGRVHLGPGGTVDVGISRTFGGGETDLGEVALPLRVSAGQQLNLQMQVTGTNPVALSVRAWAVGASTPGWQHSTTDSSSSRITLSGSVGIWDYVSGSAVPTTIAHDQFIAYEISPDGEVTSLVESPTSSPSGTVYRAASFDSMPSGDVIPSNFIAALGSTNPNEGAYDDMSVVADSRGSGKVIRTVLRAGTIHSKPGSDNGDNLFITLPGSYDRACMQYDVKFDGNFDWSLGGKLPGLEGVAPGVAPSTPTGANNTDLGWSGRLMWLGPEAYGWAGPTNMAVSYMYHAGQAGTYGDNIRWNRPFVAGRWHTVKQCHVMNTPGQANGQLKAWIDGAQVVNDSAFNYRTRSDVHITHLIFSIFRGGNTLDWAGSRDGYVDIDNFYITSA